jgi:phosphatidate cytidylyltransferase
MLKQRIITALILAPLALWGIWSLSSENLSLILGIIFTLGAWEWSRLVGLDCHLGRIGYSALFPVSFYLLYPLLQQGNWPLLVLVIALMWWVMALMSVVTYPRSGALWKNSGMAGPGFFILLMLIIWGADSGAYFAGRALGRRKLAPKVSPGKSWEGVIGGLVVALAVAAGATYWLQPVGGYAAFLALVFVTVFVSVLGDLMESLFKRVMDLKDSGGILPGHGGVLDRIDSLTAASPFFTLGLLWLSR